MDDIANFQTLKNAFTIMKISPQEQFNIFSVLGAILQLGNIQFAPVEDNAEILNKQALELAAELLG